MRTRIRVKAAETADSRTVMRYRANPAVILLLIILPALIPFRAEAVRIKDIATFGGVRSNELVGYGLVVGLSGTGDGTGSEFTIRSVANMLEQMGVGVDQQSLKVENVAAVMVSAEMPVSAKPGSELDVTVSSMGDAESLYGGVLLLTPLRGIDGKIYALSQGALTIGGYSVEGDAASVEKNVTTVGRIPGGAVVERGVPFAFNQQDHLQVNLQTSDFSTTMQVVNRINGTMGGQFARAEDISTVHVEIPDQYRGNLVPLMASLENLQVVPDGKANVVVDEKTGTIVVGNQVRLSPVAVAHGTLQVVVQETPEVSQPEPFGQGETAIVPRTQLVVQEEQQRLMLVEGSTLQELVEGLNAIGATPRDLISILRTLKAAGALHAELEVL